ncbi:hypothetical protein LDENG_00209790 [Lucifuga dentata]|nr:hypothetical protein LDENG_00209790 [Lucifuga dentata]
MQLHAYVLLFIITTDKTLALVHHQCGGNVHLDQALTGQISLMPGLLTNTNSHNPMIHQTEQSLPVAVCTWMIDFPNGQMVILTVARLESGSSISVRCVRDQEEQILKTGKTALLLGCDRNKAAVTWTGLEHSSNAIQLSYYVQEAERNSLEQHSSPDSDQDLPTAIPWSQTGFSITSKAPIVPQQTQEVIRATEEGIGHHYVGLGWSSRSQSASSPSPLDQELLQTSSSLLGLIVAGTDKKTLPLPQEEPNNGADTSGAAHITDDPMTARESTHPYFHTQHPLSMDTLLNTETYSHPPHTLLTDTFPQTQMAHTLTHSAISSSNIILDGDTHKYTATPTVRHTEYTALPLTSSPPELPSLRTWETGTVLMPHGEPVDVGLGDKQGHAYRNQRSTDGLPSNSAATVTSAFLKSSSNPQEHVSSNAHTDVEPTSSSSSSLSSSSSSSSTHITEPNTPVGAVVAASRQTDSFVSAASDIYSQTATFESSDKLQNTTMLHTRTPDLKLSASHSQTRSPQITTSVTHTSPAFSLFTQTSNKETRTAKQNLEKAGNPVNAYITSNTVTSSTGIAKDDDWTSKIRGSPSPPTTPLTLGDIVLYTTAIGTHNTDNMKGNKHLQQTGTDTKSYVLRPTHTLLNESSNTPRSFTVSLPTLTPILPSTVSTDDISTHSSIPENTFQTQTTFPGSLHTTHVPLPLTSSTTESSAHKPLRDHKTTATPSGTTTFKSTSTHTTPIYHSLSLPSSTNVSVAFKQFHKHIVTTHTALPSLTAANTDTARGATRAKAENGIEDFVMSVVPQQRFPSSPNTQTVTTQQPPSWTAPHPTQESHLEHTSSTLTSASTWTSTTSQTPKYYIVPDQPVGIRVELIELLLQIIVEESSSAVIVGLEEYTTAWVEPYLLRAPGFRRVLGVWSRGHAVQTLLEFQTRGALQWLETTGPTSLLERTGLAQALREGRTFRSSKITNITVGGVQGSVCDWLLQCPAGYQCVPQPGIANHSCSSVCYSDYCHHHGICTHHTGQLPVCRCLVGEDFWYMGQRCDVKMTRARLVGACLAILLIMVTIIAVMALVAVRRYKAILIQAKVDQTRSSYRRFNHFDELSGRFWLRSRAGSADSMDNPAFTRSDELLHLQALDRPCCYHDDTLSLASTSPSHGTHINTIYPHSSQYGWRGSEMSIGDGVLDSGKASDLSVCSWPVEPIQWTPFPLLQQLASHRTPTVRASRPRSYCEGMELVDMGKSWTA